jgi:putative transposase
MTTRGRKRHSPEQIIAKLRDAEAMLNLGKDLAVALQTIGVSQSTYDRWRAQYGGVKAQEAKRLKELEDENRGLKRLVADQALDIQMLKHINEGNWQALPGSVRRSASCKVRSSSPSEGHARC